MDVQEGGRTPFKDVAAKIKEKLARRAQRARGRRRRRRRSGPAAGGHGLRGRGAEARPRSARRDDRRAARRSSASAAMPSSRRRSSPRRRRHLGADQGADRLRGRQGRGAVLPAGVPPLAEIKQRVIEAIKRERAEAIAMEKAKALATAAREGDLIAVAKKDGVEQRRDPALLAGGATTRQTSAPGDGDGRGAADPAGPGGRAGEDAAGFYVVKTLERQPADPRLRPRAGGAGQAGARAEARPGLGSWIQRAPADGQDRDEWPGRGSEAIAHDAMDKTALLVIDAQQECFAPIGKVVLPGGPAAVARIARVLEWARATQMPVFHIVHESRSRRGDLRAGLARAGGAPAGDAPGGRARDPEASPRLLHQYAARGRAARPRHRARIIVSGFMTQMCCDTTAREAAHRGFAVTMLSDATRGNGRRGAGRGGHSPRRCASDPSRQPEWIPRRGAVAAPT